MSRLLPSICLAALLLPATAAAQIRVHPTGVNVNAQGATTVLLTFGGLGEYRPVEALWCRTLVPAAPDVGLRCDPSTILGSLPIRYDQSRLSAQSVFTDVMSIPPSVTRRAYQAAEAGDNSGFFYVRRFSRPGGGPDQYVAVTCRMSGGGARVPFSLVDVRLAFDVETPVLFVETGDQPPPLTARIVYNGTGRLKGRWEVALPGEEIPGARDLLTEASLPPEERGRQRRYTEVGRFNVFLSPGTRNFTLPGPDPRRLPTSVDGTHYLLLRVEVSDDKEGDSNLAAAGAGTGTVHAGAVAGFPMPPLRYVVGGARSQDGTRQTPGGLTLVTPLDNAAAPAEQPIEFTWNQLPQAAAYRVEIESASGVPILSALVESGVVTYRAPEWFRAKVPDGRVRWRVVALDAIGNEIRVSAWRALTTEP
ncbi:MAG TPA: hypothetical protein VI485_03360 [Vicinamibacterales bacterium]|nr:hypothetical protein [Vicinamibacterales bacterium]